MLFRRSGMRASVAISLDLYAYGLGVRNPTLQPRDNVSQFPDIQGRGDLAVNLVPTSSHYITFPRLTAYEIYGCMSSRENAIVFPCVSPCVSPCGFPCVSPCRQDATRGGGATNMPSAWVLAHTASDEAHRPIDNRKRSRWREISADAPPVRLSNCLAPMSHLDQLIAAGWGDVPQNKIPADWRERRPSRGCTEERRQSIRATMVRRSRERVDRLRAAQA